MSKIVKTQLLIRNDISANWASVNPILKKGEVGFDSTLQKFKTGDGKTAWTSLPYNSADISFDFGDEG